MTMCLDSKNTQSSYPIVDREMSIKNRDNSNYTFVLSSYVKLVCEFESILKHDRNCEEEKLR